MNLVKGLDVQSTYIDGEKGHKQYDWSANLDEKITEFYFQLVRNSDKSLENKFIEILTKINSDTTKYKNELILLYKITAHTRDIIDGKGEMDLCWMQLYNWWKINPKIAYFLTDKIVYMKGFHQYGSWKDIKYLCYYIYNKTNNKDHDYIEYLISLTNFYLRKFLKNKNNNSLKLLTKWIPREKSKKFGWVFVKLAKDYNKKYIETAQKNEVKMIKAVKKSCMEYRKLIAEFNKELKTVQINMCNKTWGQIEIKNITSKTMNKNMTAFLNLKQNNGRMIQRSTDEDRIECASNLKNYLELAKNKDTNIKINGKRCNVYEYVRDAIKHSDNKIQKEIINAQWEDNKNNNTQLGKIIPMVDVSGSMETDDCIPLYNSVGLGIRISEKTHDAFKNRIMTFSSNPKWIILEEGMSFCDKVYKVKHAEWGMTTDIYKAFRSILDVIKVNQVPPDDIADLTLAIFSDMQIDQAIGQKSFSVLYDSIKQMFDVAGLESIYKKPYQVPHILFWNLRRTSGFPSKTTTKNTTMLSGYNSSLLNVFQEKGIDDLQKVTPIQMLKDLLSKERYRMLEDFITSLD